MIEFQIYTVSLPRYSSKIYNLEKPVEECLIKKYRTVEIDETKYKLRYSEMFFYLVPKRGRKKTIYHSYYKDLNLKLKDILKNGLSTLHCNSNTPFIESQEFKNKIVNNQDLFIDWDYAED